MDIERFIYTFLILAMFFVPIIILIYRRDKRSRADLARRVPEEIERMQKLQKAVAYVHRQRHSSGCCIAHSRNTVV